MSATTIQSSGSVSPMNGLSREAHLASVTRSANPRGAFSTFVDLRISPYPFGGLNDHSVNEQPSGAPSPMPDNNPVPDLIPDELYYLLRSNDLINEKGVRDYIIRKAFKAMREQHELKSSEALERLQAVYPYLQIDTIRKIIYRIGPGGNRKALM